MTNSPSGATVAVTGASMPEMVTALLVIAAPGAASVTGSKLKGSGVSLGRERVTTENVADSSPTLTVTVTVAPDAMLAVTRTATVSPALTSALLPASAPLMTNTPSGATVAVTGASMPEMVTSLLVTAAPGSASVTISNTNGSTPPSAVVLVVTVKVALTPPTSSVAVVVPPAASLATT